MFQNQRTQHCILSHRYTSQRGETCAIRGSAEISLTAQQHQLALNSCSSFCCDTSSAAPFPLTFSLQRSGTVLSCHVVQGLPCDCVCPSIRKQQGKISVPNPPFRNSVQPQRAPVLQGALTSLHGHSKHGEEDGNTEQRILLIFKCYHTTKNVFQLPERLLS